MVDFMAHSAHTAGWRLRRLPPRLTRESAGVPPVVDCLGIAQAPYDYLHDNWFNILDER